MRFIVILTFFGLLSFGCENDLAAVEEIFSKGDASIETARNVEILYSSDQDRQNLTINYNFL